MGIVFPDVGITIPNVPCSDCGIAGLKLIYAYIT